MEKRKLVRPQSTETVENVVVYACEAPNLCPNNSVFVYDLRPCLVVAKEDCMDTFVR